MECDDVDRVLAVRESRYSQRILSLEEGSSHSRSMCNMFEIFGYQFCTWFAMCTGLDKP
jgi:hypothetical protein